MRAARHCRLLLLVAVLSTVTVGQTIPSPSAADPKQPAAANVIACGTFAASDTSLDLVSKLCLFALTYRHKLPDFIAQQTTASHGLRTTTVITAQVTYREGLEHYSRVTINGKAVAPKVQVNFGLRLFTSGEFGPLLINLFEVPGAAEFKLRKRATLNGTAVAIYDFHLPKNKNTFWAIRDPYGETLKPEFQGQLWLDQQSGLPLREELEPKFDEDTTGIASAKFMTDYAMTAVSDAGTFLLPVRSESTVCSDALGMQDMCTTNVVSFHDYQKFVATSRIMPAESQP
jgi:hypothetical protein